MAQRSAAAKVVIPFLVILGVLWLLRPLVFGSLGLPVEGFDDIPQKCENQDQDTQMAQIAYKRAQMKYQEKIKKTEQNSQKVSMIEDTITGILKEIKNVQDLHDQCKKPLGLTGNLD